MSNTYANYERLRIAAGDPTNYRVATDAGVPLWVIYRWKNNNYVPKYPRLKRIADALHCSVDDFFKDPEDGQTDEE